MTLRIARSCLSRWSPYDLLAGRGARRAACSPLPAARTVIYRSEAMGFCGGAVGGGRWAMCLRARMRMRACGAVACVLPTVRACVGCVGVWGCVWGRARGRAWEVCLPTELARPVGADDEVQHRFLQRHLCICEASRAASAVPVIGGAAPPCRHLRPPRLRQSAMGKAPDESRVSARTSPTCQPRALQSDSSGRYEGEVSVSSPAHAPTRPRCIPGHPVRDSSSRQ